MLNAAILNQDSVAVGFQVKNRLARYRDNGTHPPGGTTWPVKRVRSGMIVSFSSSEFLSELADQLAA